MGKKHEVDRSLLIKAGMKGPLLDKLEAGQLRWLICYAMDNIKMPNLLTSLVTLASMELQNKKGAIYLAAHDMATPLQLKNLSAHNIKTLVSDYEFHQDEKLIIKNIKEMLIVQQQEKLFTKTDGVKGEYFMDQRAAEDVEDEYNI